MFNIEQHQCASQYAEGSESSGWADRKIGLTTSIAMLILEGYEVLQPDPGFVYKVAVVLHDRKSYAEFFHIIDQLIHSIPNRFQYLSATRSPRWIDRIFIADKDDNCCVQIHLFHLEQEMRTSIKGYRFHQFYIDNSVGYDDREIIRELSHSLIIQ